MRQNIVGAGRSSVDALSNSINYKKLQRRLPSPVKVPFYSLSPNIKGLLDEAFVC